MVLLIVGLYAQEGYCNLECLGLTCRGACAQQ